MTPIGTLKMDEQYFPWLDSIIGNLYVVVADRYQWDEQDIGPHSMLMTIK